ncbi:conjugal transfer protein [Streptomyces sp. NPDC088794]|uniref:conjugal transfer protein n=1 Tax=Streptomyces sp. NPDC088794 TaxID=3365902 RepID=UPI003829F11F
MSPDKQASQSESGAPTAAGARLERMRRSARLARLALLTAIAAGPIALGIAVWPGPTTTAAAPTAKPTTERTAAPAANPSGYAQLFVGAWLRSSTDNASTAQARLAQAMAPDVELPGPAADAHTAPQSVTAVRSAQRDAGVWSVTVAAQYADGRLRYYVVPVTANSSGASFSVTDAPAVVAGPARAETPTSPYSVTVPDSELSSAIGQFLTAYLTGTGEVDRYLAPKVKLTALSPAPYTSATVQQIVAVEQAAAAEEVPDDGTRVRVRVAVQARDDFGRWPLAYELTLTSRSDRWEIAALQTGTAQNEGAR